MSDKTREATARAWNQVHARVNNMLEMLSADNANADDQYEREATKLADELVSARRMTWNQMIEDTVAMSLRDRQNDAVERTPGRLLRLMLAYTDLGIENLVPNDGKDQSVTDNLLDVASMAKLEASNARTALGRPVTAREGLTKLPQELVLEEGAIESQDEQWRIVETFAFSDNPNDEVRTNLNVLERVAKELAQNKPIPGIDYGLRTLMRMPTIPETELAESTHEIQAEILRATQTFDHDDQSYRKTHARVEDCLEKLRPRLERERDDRLESAKETLRNRGVPIPETRTTPNEYDKSNAAISCEP